MLERDVSNADLAKGLGLSEATVQRLLDLDHRSGLGQIEAALTKLGKRLEIRVSDAA
jgi:DNA-binding Xre family transcriptional regulator